MTAADAVKRETGVEKCNVVGYCVGGTLLATTLAYLAARGEEPFNSATFLTTQVDFTKAGDLLLFTDDSQLEALEELMVERGYLDGSRMANVFNMMRPRDLIWPYIVNNYLLGKKPFPFDLLYWNQDSTRMAAANHNFYLREFYNENRLAAGNMTHRRHQARPAQGEAADLRAGDEGGPHRAGAVGLHRRASCSAATSSSCSPGSGHIAGVVNPPDKMKYQYWTSGKRSANSLEEWLATAKEHPGSWWPHWAGVAGRAFRRMDHAARAGRNARRHRGRARLLREGQILKRRTGLGSPFYAVFATTLG